jgi:hypothetical protein
MEVLDWFPNCETKIGRAKSFPFLTSTTGIREWESDLPYGHLQRRRPEVYYISPAMARRVDRERSILGTELEEPKIGRSGREGRGRGSVSKT